MGALLHGDEHDVGDAHDAAHERQEAQDPQEGADDPLGVIHLHVVRVAVVDPDAPPVVRRHIVPEAQGAAVFFFKGLVIFLGLRAVHCECDASDLVAGVVNSLVGGVGDGAGAVHVGFVGMVDADHPEGDRSGAHPFAYEGFRVFRRELLGLREAQDDDLAAFLDVVRVQEPAGMHLDLVLLLVFGQDARNLAGDRVPVQGESDARGSGLAGDVPDGAGPARPFRPGDVRLVQFDHASFLVTGIRLGGAPAFHRDVLGDEVRDVAHERVHQAVPGAQQADQQEDAPAHREAREGRAELVVPQVAGYFVEKFPHVLVISSEVEKSTSSWFRPRPYGPCSLRSRR